MQLLELVYVEQRNFVDAFAENVPMTLLCSNLKQRICYSIITVNMSTPKRTGHPKIVLLGSPCSGKTVLYNLMTGNEKETYDSFLFSTSGQFHMGISPEFFTNVHILTQK